LKSLLGLGSNFCPQPAAQTLDSVDLERFRRDYNRRLLFSGAEESEVPTLYAKNEDWEATPPVQELEQRYLSFNLQIRQNFANHKKLLKSNLLQHQTYALKWLQNNTDIVVMDADKNLGPVVMEKTKYVNYAWNDHLSDSNTYKQLSENEAKRMLKKIEEEIFTFMDIFNLDCEDELFISRTTEKSERKPSFMYLLAKIHKPPPENKSNHFI